MAVLRDYTDQARQPGHRGVTCSRYGEPPRILVRGRTVAGPGTSTLGHGGEAAQAERVTGRHPRLAWAELAGATASCHGSLSTLRPRDWLLQSHTPTSFLEVP